MRALQNVASVVPGTGGDVSWEAALKYEHDRYKKTPRLYNTVDCKYWRFKFLCS